MVSGNILYIIGFAFVVVYLLLGIDDFIWDIFNLFNRQKFRGKSLDMCKLGDIPPKLLAVVVAAWHEDEVLEDVIDNIIASPYILNPCIIFSLVSTPMTKPPTPPPTSWQKNIPMCMWL